MTIDLSLKRIKAVFVSSDTYLLRLAEKKYFNLNGSTFKLTVMG